MTHYRTFHELPTHWCTAPSFFVPSAQWSGVGRPQTADPAGGQGGFRLCLCDSALQALAKSFSEFQENTFVVRIAELRLSPLPDGTFRFENTVFHLTVPDRQRLVLFAEHGLEEGFNQYVH
jgi:hypothetical protein